jgi:hypothetical protein
MVAPWLFDEGPERFGRRLYGARRSTWAALEDKIAVGDLFRASGIAQAPHVVCPAERAVDHVDGLDEGMGTVWALDNSEGWHGGTEGTRWVASDAAPLAAATDWASGHADVVRVMPFLDGTPCSIHAFVTGRGIAVFRPIEMIILRGRGNHTLRYAGISGFWEPSDRLSTEMRDVALRVAFELDRSVGYRGPFSVDGIAGADGFRPTELNPRWSPGFAMQADAVEDVDIAALTWAVIEDEVDVDPHWVEAQVLAAGSRHRTGRLTTTFNVERPAATLRVAFTGHEPEIVADGEGVAELAIGPGAAGSIVFLRFDAESGPTGELMAPYALAGARLASTVWNLPLEELEVAPDLDQ